MPCSAAEFGENESSGKALTRIFHGWDKDRTIMTDLLARIRGKRVYRDKSVKIRGKKRALN